MSDGTEHLCDQQMTGLLRSPSAGLDPYPGSMSQARRKLGEHAEATAAQYLQDRGWQVLARNARTRHGELDLIAYSHPRLAFVEVKAARAGAFYGPERPALAVDSRKQARIRRLSAAWLTENSPPSGCREFRFDVIGITYAGDGSIADFEHIENAF